MGDVIKMKRKRKNKQGFLIPGSIGDMKMDIPIPSILSGMEAMIRELQKRGIDISDWDDKRKKLRQVRIIGGKVYFFAEKEDENEI